ncbi:carboxymuconolactone decarboxylase family protein [Pseudonocardia nantongensis]|uniref:carboxymuconolactone decarboxylase family protein n=1 Tax=Pseudonocardia nantongensis TaxID=1181885 RepID=UPI003979E176
MTEHPPADARNWGGRLPRNETLDLDDDQRAAVEALHERQVPWAERSGFVATDSDGGLLGPFNAFALRPAQGRAFQRWVGTDQRHSTLPEPVREVVILTVGAAWQADYELYAHAAAARTAGLSEEAVAALRAGSGTADLGSAERVAHRFADELARTHRVTGDTYAAADAAFGRDGVLDLVHLVGQYLAVSALLNAFEIPAPGDAPPA